MQNHYRYSPALRGSWLSILAVGALALSAGPVRAGDEGTVETPAADEKEVATAQDEVTQEAVGTAAQSEAGMPVGLRAMRVYRDPATGKLTHRPPPGVALRLSEEMQRRVSRSSDGLKSRTLLDGTSLLDLEGRYLLLSVAKLGSEGTLVNECFTNAEQAEAFWRPEVFVSAEDRDGQ